MLRLLVSHLYSLLGVGGAIATLILFKRDFYENIPQETYWAVLFLGFFAVYYFVESAYWKIKLSKRKEYGAALPLINIAFEEIHKLHRIDNEYSDEDDEHRKKDIFHALVELCTLVAHAFHRLTGRTCAVTIKILGKGSGENADRLKVETLCRDKESIAVDRARQDVVDHWIDGNSDFLYLVENHDNPKGRCYLDNFLKLNRKYKNTSFKVYGEKDRDYDKLGVLRRFLFWPLPYKSTVIVPICPGLSSPQEISNLIGFLCIDSKNHFAFRKAYDQDLLIGIADGLFNTLREFKDLIYSSLDPPSAQPSVRSTETS